MHLVTQYNVNETFLAVFQGMCSLLGIVGTVLVTKSSALFSLRKSASLFLLFQVISLWIACICLWLKWPAIFLVTVAISRIGLWGFDVAHMSVMQSGLTKTDYRATITVMQYGLCNIFSVSSEVAALFWHSPAGFPMLIALSLLCVTLAWLCLQIWCLQLAKED